MTIHRDRYLDSYIGKRVRLLTTDGQTYDGLFGFDDMAERYTLDNLIDKKTGFPLRTVYLRKTHIKEISHER